jgi:hypothetical protein
VELHRVGLDRAEAVHPGDELVEEDVAPHLAVGDDVDARRLLDAQGLVDGTVLDRLVLARVERPRTHRLARLDEPRRAQHRADDIGVVDHWSPLSVLT